MMEDIRYDDLLRKQINDLTLILLYLNSWTEKDTGEACHRSWQGYDFDDLVQLAEKGYISEGRRSKSVVLYEDGIAKAKEWLDTYGISDGTRTGN